jgi:hypothetical protein
MNPNLEQIKELLDFKSNTYNDVSFIEDDPVSWLLPFPGDKERL